MSKLSIVLLLALASASLQSVALGSPGPAAQPKRYLEDIDDADTQLAFIATDEEECAGLRGIRVHYRDYCIQARDDVGVFMTESLKSGVRKVLTIMFDSDDEFDVDEEVFKVKANDVQESAKLIESGLKRQGSSLNRQESGLKRQESGLKRQESGLKRQKTMTTPAEANVAAATAALAATNQETKEAGDAASTQEGQVAEKDAANAKQLSADENALALQDNAEAVKRSSIWSTITEAVRVIINTAIELILTETAKRIARLKARFTPEEIKSFVTQACDAISYTLVDQMETKFLKTRADLMNSGMFEEEKELLEVARVSFESVGCLTTSRLISATKFCGFIKVAGPAVYPIFGL